MTEKNTHDVRRPQSSDQEASEPGWHLSPAGGHTTSCHVTAEEETRMSLIL